MDRLIYLAMSGAKATMQRQETLSNNLANASTTGFRAELAAFRAVPVEGSGASTRVYSLESTIGYDATPGQVAATGRNLDVAMRGSAWLAVQGRDGTEAYTRGGSLDIDSEGMLVTASGLQVLGDGGPIQIPPDSQVAIAADTNARLQDGALEGSNVSTVETMVQMIAAARQFEAQMRSLSTAEGNDKSAQQLLSVG